MNEALLKKIGKYSAAAGTALLTGNMANAEIIKKDTIVALNSSQDIYVDFDGDGTYELDLHMRVYSGYHSMRLFHVKSNVSLFIKGINQAVLLSSNKVIEETLTGAYTWKYLTQNRLASTSSPLIYGILQSHVGEICYTGFRFTKDGGTNYYYGWMKYQVSSTFPFDKNNELYGWYLGFAYENTPNTPILAGQTPIPVPVLPAASALGLGLIGLMGYFRSRRKKEN